MATACHYLGYFMKTYITLDATPSKTIIADLSPLYDDLQINVTNDVPFKMTSFEFQYPDEDRFVYYFDSDPGSFSLSHTLYIYVNSMAPPTYGISDQEFKDAASNPCSAGGSFGKSSPWTIPPGMLQVLPGTIEEYSNQYCTCDTCGGCVPTVRFRVTSTLEDDSTQVMDMYLAITGEFANFRLFEPELMDTELIYGRKMSPKYRLKRTYDFNLPLYATMLSDTRNAPQVNCFIKEEISNYTTTGSAKRLAKCLSLTGGAYVDCANTGFLTDVENYYVSGWVKVKSWMEWDSVYNSEFRQANPSIERSQVLFGSYDEDTGCGFAVYSTTSDFMRKVIYGTGLIYEEYGDGWTHILYARTTSDGLPVEALWVNAIPATIEGGPTFGAQIPQEGTLDGNPVTRDLKVGVVDKNLFIGECGQIHDGDNVITNPMAAEYREVVFGRNVLVDQEFASLEYNNGTPISHVEDADTRVFHLNGSFDNCAPLLEDGYFNDTSAYYEFLFDDTYYNNTTTQEPVPDYGSGYHGIYIPHLKVDGTINEYIETLIFARDGYYEGDALVDFTIKTDVLNCYDRPSGNKKTCILNYEDSITSQISLTIAPAVLEGYVRDGVSAVEAVEIAWNNDKIYTGHNGSFVIPVPNEEFSAPFSYGDATVWELGLKNGKLLQGLPSRNIDTGVEARKLYVPGRPSTFKLENLDEVTQVSPPAMYTMMNVAFDDIEPSFPPDNWDVFYALNPKLPEGYTAQIYAATLHIVLKPHSTTRFFDAGVMEYGIWSRSNDLHWRLKEVTGGMVNAPGHRLADTEVPFTIASINVTNFVKGCWDIDPADNGEPIRDFNPMPFEVKTSLLSIDPWTGSPVFINGYSVGSIVYEQDQHKQTIFGDTQYKLERPPEYVADHGPYWYNVVPSAIGNVFEKLREGSIGIGTYSGIEHYILEGPAPLYSDYDYTSEWSVYHIPEVSVTIEQINATTTGRRRAWPPVWSWNTERAPDYFHYPPITERDEDGLYKYHWAKLVAGIETIADAPTGTIPVAWSRMEITKRQPGHRYFFLSKVSRWDANRYWAHKGTLDNVEPEPIVGSIAISHDHGSIDATPKRTGIYQMKDGSATSATIYPDGNYPTQTLDWEMCELRAGGLSAPYNSSYWYGWNFEGGICDRVKRPANFDLDQMRDGQCVRVGWLDELNKQIVFRNQDQHITYEFGSWPRPPETIECGPDTEYYVTDLTRRVGKHNTFEAIAYSGVTLSWNRYDILPEDSSPGYMERYVTGSQTGWSIPTSKWVTIGADSLPCDTFLEVQWKYWPCTATLCPVLQSIGTLQGINCPERVDGYINIWETSNVAYGTFESAWMSLLVDTATDFPVTLSYAPTGDPPELLDVGNALMLDGTQYVTGDDAGFLDGETLYGMGMWVYFNEIPATGRYGLMSTMNDAGTKGMSLYFQDGVLTADWKFVENSDSRTFNTTFNTGVWYHIVVAKCMDGFFNAIKLWVNGGLDNYGWLTFASHTTGTGNGPTRIGYTGVAGEAYLNANIDEVFFIKSHDVTTADVVSYYAYGDGLEFTESSTLTAYHFNYEIDHGALNTGVATFTRGILGPTKKYDTGGNVVWSGLIATMVTIDLAAYVALTSSRFLIEPTSCTIDACFHYSMSNVMTIPQTDRVFYVYPGTITAEDNAKWIHLTFKAPLAGVHCFSNTNHEPYFQLLNTQGSGGLAGRWFDFHKVDPVALTPFTTIADRCLGSINHYMWDTAGIYQELHVGGTGGGQFYQPSVNMIRYIDICDMRVNLLGSCFGGQSCNCPPPWPPDPPNPPPGPPPEPKRKSYTQFLLSGYEPTLEKIEGYTQYTGIARRDNRALLDPPTPIDNSELLRDLKNQSIRNQNRQQNPVDTSRQILYSRSGSSSNLTPGVGVQAAQNTSPAINNPQDRVNTNSIPGRTSSSSPTGMEDQNNVRGVNVKTRRPGEGGKASNVYGDGAAVSNGLSNLVNNQNSGKEKSLQSLTNAAQDRQMAGDPGAADRIMSQKREQARQVNNMLSDAGLSSISSPGIDGDVARNNIALNTPPILPMARDIQETNSKNEIERSRRDMGPQGSPIQEGADISRAWNNAQTLAAAPRGDIWSGPSPERHTNRQTGNIELDNTKPTVLTQGPDLSEKRQAASDGVRLASAPHNLMPVEQGQRNIGPALGTEAVNPREQAIRMDPSKVDGPMRINVTMTTAPHNMELIEKALRSKL